MTLSGALVNGLAIVAATALVSIGIYLSERTLSSEGAG